MSFQLQARLNLQLLGASSQNKIPEDIQSSEAPPQNPFVEDQSSKIALQIIQEEDPALEDEILNETFSKIVTLKVKADMLNGNPVQED
jgi:hypothetical protein